MPCRHSQGRSAGSPAVRCGRTRPTPGPGRHPVSAVGPSAVQVGAASREFEEFGSRPEFPGKRRAEWAQRGIGA
ncbi:hypothetical protein DY218_19360 [Streptomyces triticagri]|uniref:Uncharacterized protein n=1 Tax=Streptomyces triticagri TaxID=2293568 RepID=A0A372M2N3_9ACTN|nr:hypothetical protein DY218_19360 [Streptomyces triticagri]